MAEVPLTAREAACLRAFAKIALEMRFFRVTIGDEVDQVIGEALERIGRQLAGMGCEDGLLAEDLMPTIFQPREYLDPGLDLDTVLRQLFEEIH